jgi:hypothetical protein
MCPVHGRAAADISPLANLSMPPIPTESNSDVVRAVLPDSAVIAPGIENSAVVSVAPLSSADGEAVSDPNSKPTDPTIVAGTAKVPVCASVAANNANPSRALVAPAMAEKTATVASAVPHPYASAPARAAPLLIEQERNAVPGLLPMSQCFNEEGRPAPDLPAVFVAAVTRASGVFHLPQIRMQADEKEGFAQGIDPSGIVGKVEAKPIPMQAEQKSHLLHDTQFQTGRVRYRSDSGGSGGPVRKRPRSAEGEKGVPDSVVQIASLPCGQPEPVKTRSIPPDDPVLHLTSPSGPSRGSCYSDDADSDANGADADIGADADSGADADIGDDNEVGTDDPIVSGGGAPCFETESDPQIAKYHSSDTPDPGARASVVGSESYSESPFLSSSAHAAAAVLSSPVPVRGRTRGRPRDTGDRRACAGRQDPRVATAAARGDVSHSFRNPVAELGGPAIDGAEREQQKVQNCVKCGELENAYLRMERKLKELEKQVHDYRADQENLRQRTAAALSTVTLRDARIDTLERKLLDSEDAAAQNGRNEAVRLPRYEIAMRDKEADIAKLFAERKKRDMRIEELESDLETMEEANVTYVSKLQDMQNKYLASEDKNIELSKLNKAHTEELKKSLTETRNVSKAYKELKDQLDMVQRVSNMAKEELSNVRQKSKEDLESADNQIGSRNRTICGLKKEVGDLKRDDAKSKAAVEKLEGQLKEHMGRIGHAVSSIGPCQRADCKLLSVKKRDLEHDYAAVRQSSGQAICKFEAENVRANTSEKEANHLRDRLDDSQKAVSSYRLQWQKAQSENLRLDSLRKNDQMRLGKMRELASSAIARFSAFEPKFSALAAEVRSNQESSLDPTVTNVLASAAITLPLLVESPVAKALTPAPVSTIAARAADGDDTGDGRSGVFCEIVGGSNSKMKAPVVYDSPDPSELPSRIDTGASADVKFGTETDMEAANKAAGGAADEANPAEQDEADVVLTGTSSGTIVRGEADLEPAATCDGVESA